MGLRMSSDVRVTQQGTQIEDPSLGTLESTGRVTDRLPDGEDTVPRGFSECAAFFTFSLIGFKRIICRNIFQRLLRATRESFLAMLMCI